MENNIFVIFVETSYYFTTNDNHNSDDIAHLLDIIEWFQPSYHSKQFQEEIGHRWISQIRRC